MSIFLFDEAFRDMVVPYRTLRAGLVTLPAGVGNAWRSHADVIAYRDALIAAGA